MELNSCINFLLSASQNAVFQYLSEPLADYGITPAQYGVLNCLWNHECLSPKQIGEILYLEASSISSILERMQKNGLIDRNVDPENRRVILVSATQKAKEIEKPVERIIEEMNEVILEPFSEHEKDVLLKSLQTVIMRKHKKS